MVSSNLNLDELNISIRTINPNKTINSNSIISRNKKFNQRLSRTLYLNSGYTVKKLFLNLCYDGRRQIVDQWYHFIMTNEVTEFNISFSNGISTRYDVASMPYEFPHIQPISKSLECLKLSVCNFLKSNLKAFSYL